MTENTQTRSQSNSRPRSIIRVWLEGVVDEINGLRGVFSRRGEVNGQFKSLQNAHAAAATLGNPADRLLAYADLARDMDRLGEAQMNAYLPRRLLTIVTPAAIVAGFSLSVFVPLALMAGVTGLAIAAGRDATVKAARKALPNFYQSMYDALEQAKAADAAELSQSPNFSAAVKRFPVLGLAFAAAAPKDSITEGADAQPQPGRAAPATSAKGAPRS